MTIIKTLFRHRLVQLTLAAYGVALAFSPTLFASALENTRYYLLEMVLVMPVIFLMTMLIDVWVSRETIIRHMGEGSGIRGAGFSILLGSLSAGPIYAAFPIAKMLLSKGASVANLVVILSAWAVIKVPMLANEARFLGPRFMVIRWIATVITIYVMGIVVSMVVRREDIPDSTVCSSSSGLQVLESACIGCGKCTRAYARYFSMNDSKAVIHDHFLRRPIPDAPDVVSVCPTNAIVYES